MASVTDLNIRELTIKKLTELAKKRGLKGYSKKINLNWYGYWNHKKTLFLCYHHKLQVKYSVLRNTRLTKDKSLKRYANYKWNSFVNWLTQHLPPKPKVIDEAFWHVKNTILKLYPRKKDIFGVEETKSALGEFVKEYVITSRDVYDPDSFMDAAKETVINLLENNRQTKLKLILKCKEQWKEQKLKQGK